MMFMLGFVSGIVTTIFLMMLTSHLLITNNDNWEL